MTQRPAFDQDALIAAVDLIARTGAIQSTIGYLDDRPGTRWYAEALFKGAKIIGEGAGPVEASEDVARQLLFGALCRRCGKLIQLADPEEGLPVGCRWTRLGRRWVPGCGRDIDRSIPLEPFQAGYVPPE